MAYTNHNLLVGFTAERIKLSQLQEDPVGYFFQEELEKISEAAYTAVTGLEKLAAFQYSSITDGEFITLCQVLHLPPDMVEKTASAHGISSMFLLHNVLDIEEGGGTVKVAAGFSSLVAPVGKAVSRAASSVRGLFTKPVGRLGSLRNQVASRTTFASPVEAHLASNLANPKAALPSTLSPPTRAELGAARTFRTQKLAPNAAEADRVQRLLRQAPADRPVGNALQTVQNAPQARLNRAAAKAQQRLQGASPAAQRAAKQTRGAAQTQRTQANAASRAERAKTRAAAAPAPTPQNSAAAPVSSPVQAVQSGQGAVTAAPAATAPAATAPAAPGWGTKAWNVAKDVGSGVRDTVIKPAALFGGLTLGGVGLGAGMGLSALGQKPVSPYQ